MNFRNKTIVATVAPGLLLTGAWLAVQSGASAQDQDLTVTISPFHERSTTKPMTGREREAYQRAIERTASMVGDPDARRFTEKYGLDLLNLTWEDTGRYKGSSVGPNISDMTIQVGLEDSATKRVSVACMPVIRFPNFSDKTCDLDPRDFTILVGNQNGRSLKRISLYDFLLSPTQYVSFPNSWRSKNKSLLADRDSKVLVSAQACFLPVPQQGKATFNPVLFNYQSVSGDPAVLTILATREGTSTTVIDNKRDAFSNGSMWGQRLFHNAKGMRASLTGERLSEYRAKNPKSGTGNRNPKEEGGMNMVLLIQVPLKQHHPMQFGAGGYGGGKGADMETALPSSKRSASDVENAVIGHGALEGPFTEFDNLNVEREPNFPVRVTVQFYKATSNGVVSEQDVKEIKQQIDRVYAMSDYVGSLVTDGETGRITEYEGCKVQPRDWWEKFWQRHEQNTGDARWEAIAKLRKLLGQNYMERPVCRLYVNDLLRK